MRLKQALRQSTLVRFRFDMFLETSRSRGSEMMFGSMTCRLLFTGRSNLGLLLAAQAIWPVSAAHWTGGVRRGLPSGHTGSQVMHLCIRFVTSAGHSQRLQCNRP